MGAEGVVEIAFRKAGRRGRGPRGQEGRADRGLQQDLRRLHRRRQRPDRRRDRPARDARDDLPRAGDVGGQEGRAAVEATGGGAGMSLDDPVVITCSISGAIANREQCPAIPYTPAEYAAEARRIVDEGGVMIHIHARKPDGTPRYEIEDFQAISEAIRAEVGDAVIVNFSTGTIGVPVEKRIEYLRACRPEVAALNMGSMNYAKYSRSKKQFVFKMVFANPFERDRRAARGDERAGDQTRARVLRHRSRRLARAADRHGRAEDPAARRLRDGRRRRHPADRAQPRGDGREHPRRAARRRPRTGA